MRITFKSKLVLRLARRLQITDFIWQESFYFHCDPSKNALDYIQKWKITAVVSIAKAIFMVITVKIKVILTI